MKSSIRRLRNQAHPPVPMSRQQGFYRFTDLTLPDSTSETMMRAYGVMSTVWSCVQLLAESAGRVEWHLFRKQPVDARRRYSTNEPGVDQRTEVVQHAALSLLNRPNDFFTQTRLFELDETYLGLTGEYYWVIERPPGVNFPAGIWSVRPDRIDPVPDPDSYMSGWVYKPPDGSQPIPLKLDEVIQVALPNPLDPMHGLGPVQAILVDVDSSRYSAEWNRNFFLNSATPYGIIQTPNNLSDPEFEELMNRWRETHRGVSRSGRVGVLEGGNTFTPVAMSMKDMDFQALRNLSRDIVREAFRMHKVMLGVSDDVNRANAQTGEEVFASWGVVPRLDRKRDMLNNVFLPMFGSTGQGVEFDYVTPVPSNREQDALELKNKAQAVLWLVSAGYDQHDILEMVGLPDMDVAEQPTQQPAMPPGWVPGQPGLPPPPPDEDTTGQGQDPGLATNAMEKRLRRMLGNGHQPVQVEALRAIAGRH